jgi:hypothetical protein
MYTLIGALELPLSSHMPAYASKGRLAAWTPQADLTTTITILSTQLLTTTITSIHSLRTSVCSQSLPN